MITACEAFTMLLSRPSQGVESNKNPQTKALNSDETIQLKKAKYACSLGMVVNPLSTNKNVFFTTKENFQRMLGAKQASNNATSSTPRPNS